MDEDEYVFESALDDPATHQSNAEAQALKEDAQRALADKMRPIFQKYPKAMIEVHGRDLLKEGDEASPATSGTSTPVNNKPATPAPAPAPATATASVSAPSASATTAAAVKREQAAAANGVQTGSKVRTEGEFMIVSCAESHRRTGDLLAPETRASAHHARTSTRKTLQSATDLWDLLTNDQKVPSWSRNKATIKPEAGADVSLFGTLGFKECNVVLTCLPHRVLTDFTRFSRRDVPTSTRLIRLLRWEHHGQGALCPRP